MLSLDDDERPDALKGQYFDVITANPPYVAQGDQVGKSVGHEPGIALWAGKDGLDFISPIVTSAWRSLRDGGAMIMEFGYGQADAVRELIVGSGAWAEPRIIRDHQGIERVVVALRK